VWHRFCDRFLKRPLLSFQKLCELCQQRVMKDGDYFEGQ
jgi:hypothetical protein